MSASAATPWEALFPPPVEPGRVRELELLLVRKRGEPLLLLPARRNVAPAALTLYPAQSRTARIARWGLKAALRCGFRVGTARVKLRVDMDSLFIRFLAPSAPSAADPCFAMLLGNPRAPGRRFVLLMFDAAGRPKHVVKAGTGEPATALIRREVAFLKSAPRDLLQGPALLGQFASDGIEAIAMEFCAGPTPDAQEFASLACLLESWLDLQRTVRFAEFPAAQRLGASAPGDERVRSVFAELDGARFHPAILHGDFTPWNIRVNPTMKRWAVLDWERGETVGPPAWDWFHFVIQHEILVRHAPTERVLARVEALLHSAEFGRYAATASIGTCARPLFRAYALYCCLVQRQAEGMAQIEALIQGLQAG